MAIPIRHCHRAGRTMKAIARALLVGEAMVTLPVDVSGAQPAPTGDCHWVKNPETGKWVQVGAGCGGKEDDTPGEPGSGTLIERTPYEWIVTPAKGVSPVGT